MEVRKTKTDPICGTLIGRHRIIRFLGKGGLGSVYLAENRTNSAIEALKILSLNPENASMASSFEREIAVCTMLDHRNIVRLKDSGKSHGISYFTMEFCNGGTLASYVKKHGPLQVDKAIKILLQILDGLEYAHEVHIPQIRLNDGSTKEGSGIVHRDMKPENILIHGIGSEELFKISDFGLAKAYRFAGIAGDTQTGSIGGSLDFMCRQQILNYKYVKPEVDIWGTAAILYYMLTGMPPRKPGNPKNPINSILSNKNIAIRNVKPEISELLASVIDRALDDSGSLQYKDASSLRKDLKNATLNP